MNEHETLETIRRAYRYVVAYERRVLDAIGSVDEALLGRGFQRENSKPLYTNWPRKSKVLDPHWAWDEVPNYARGFPWRFGEANTAGNRWVLVDHVADTAFERQRLGVGSEPDPLRDLGAVEESCSILRWSVVAFAAPISSKLYNKDWPYLLPEHFGIALADLRESMPTAAPRSVEKAPLTLTTHCIDLAELTNADALRVRFVDPLLASLGAP